MAARTTVEDIRDVLDTSLTHEQLEAFLGDAAAVVDGYLVSVGLSDDQLERIEKYLACHFALARDPDVSQTGAAGTSHRYEEGTTDGQFSSTKYGRRALILDTSGTLRSLDADASAAAGAGGGATELAWATRSGQDPSDDEEG